MKRKPARTVEFTEEQMKIVKGLHLLTTKEMLYVANVSEDDIIDPSENKYVQMVKEFAENENSQVIVVCAKSNQKSLN